MEHPEKLSRQSTREPEFDLLRILACLAVITIHAVGAFDGLTVSGLERTFLSFACSCVMWAVPVFVMISGRFYLDPARPVPFTKLLRAIRRLILVFLIWNIPYQLFYYLTGAYASLNWRGIVNQVLLGPYHFWYLFMIVGLYLTVPFLRKLTASKRLLQYFILLYALFETLTAFGPMLPGVGNTLSTILSRIGFHIAVGWIGPFVIGYYLWKYSVSKKAELLIYNLALLFFLVSGPATDWLNRCLGTAEEWFTNAAKPNIILEAAAIYLFAVKRIARRQPWQTLKRLLSMCGVYSFGIYLVHALVLHLAVYLHLPLLHLTPIISLPILVLFCFLLSAGFVWLLKKLPWLGKRIV